MTPRPPRPPPVASALLCAGLALGACHRRAPAATSAGFHLPPLALAPRFAGTDRGHSAWLLGTLRMEERGARLRFSEEQTLAPLLGAAQTARGWLFVTASGQVFGSERFLGPLRPLGAVPPPVSVAPRSSGRLVLRDGAGRIYSTAGEPVSLVAELPPGEVQQLRFRDALRGTLLLDGGALYRTEDGARSWSYVPLQGPVERSGTHLRALREEDRGELPEEEPEAPEPAPPARWRSALAARYPTATRSLGAHVGERLALSEGRDVLLYDLLSGRLQRRYAGVLPHDACSLRAWGAERLAALCLGGDFTGTQRSSELGRATLTFAPVVPDPNLSTLYSDDGVHYVSDVLCGAVSGYDRAGLCVGDGATGRWERRFPEVHLLASLAMHGAQVLAFAEGQAPASRASLFVLDTDTSQRTDLAFTPVALGARVDRVFSARFDAAGVHLVLGDGEGRFYASGSPRAPLRLQPLPAGATTAVGEGPRARAFGPTLDSFSTLGGEASSLAPAAVAGQRWTGLFPTSSAPVSSFESELDASCSARGCLLGLRLLLTEGGLSSGGPRVALAPAERAQPAQARAPSRQPTRTRLSFPSFRCAQGAREPEAAPAPAPLQRLHRGELTVQTFLSARGGDEESYEVRWSGSDAEGAFSGSARFQARRSRGGYGDNGPLRYFLLGGGREGVWLSSANSDSSAALFFCSASSCRRPAPRGQHFFGDDGDRVVLGTPLPSGALAVLLRDAESRAVGVLEFDERGAQRRARDASFQAGVEVVLAQVAGQSGLLGLDLDSERPLAFYSLGGGAPMAFAWPSEGGARGRIASLCAGPRATDAALVYYVTGEELTLSPLEAATSLQVQLEVSPSRACLRSVRSHLWTEDTDEAHPSPRSLDLEAQPDGALEGVEHSAAGRARWRCTAEAPRS